MDCVQSPIDHDTKFGCGLRSPDAHAGDRLEVDQSAATLLDAVALV